MALRLQGAQDAHLITSPGTTGLVAIGPVLGALVDLHCAGERRGDAFPATLQRTAKDIFVAIQIWSHRSSRMQWVERRDLVDLNLWGSFSEAIHPNGGSTND